MTGYRSAHFRWDCKIKGCYYESLPDWDDLIECFPRGIRPTDVDGLVEIGGRVLFMEEKCAGVAPHEGQRRALLSLSKRPGVTALLFRPRVTGATDMECLVLGQSPALLDGWEPSGGWKRHSRKELRRWLEAWAARADAPDGVP